MKMDYKMKINFFYIMLLFLIASLAISNKLILNSNQLLINSNRDIIIEINNKVNELIKKQ